MKDVHFGQNKGNSKSLGGKADFMEDIVLHSLAEMKILKKFVLNLFFSDVKLQFIRMKWGNRNVQAL